MSKIAEGRPEISVIMSVYGESPDHLHKAIGSILGQTFRDFEFIIIADAPENNLLLDILEELSASDARIVLLKNTFNLGLAASLNRGIAMAQGRYIARMDADDISDPSRLQIQHDYMEANKKVDFLFSWVDYIGQEGEFRKTFSPSRQSILEIKNTFFTRDLLVHPTLFYRRSPLQRIEYDPTFMRSQDFDLWLRTIQDYRFDLIEKPLLSYRVPDLVNIDDRIKKIRQSTYWTLRALWKNKRRYYADGHFWIFTARTLLIGMIARMPHAVTIGITRIKDSYNS